MQHNIPTPDLIDLERHRPTARYYRAMAAQAVREQEKAEQARKDEAENLEGTYFCKTSDFFLGLAAGMLLGIWTASLWVQFA